MMMTTLEKRRFIPAWAGNAQWHDAVHVYTAVHPRVGGERVNAVTITFVAGGSSPRGRGTPPIGLEAYAMGRFIPAWAGNAYP